MSDIAKGVVDLMNPELQLEIYESELENIHRKVISKLKKIVPDMLHDSKHWKLLFEGASPYDRMKEGDISSDLYRQLESYEFVRHIKPIMKSIHILSAVTKEQRRAPYRILNNQIASAQMFKRIIDLKDLEQEFHKSADDYLNSNNIHKHRKDKSDEWKRWCYERAFRIPIYLGIIADTKEEFIKEKNGKTRGYLQESYREIAKNEVKSKKEGGGGYNTTTKEITPRAIERYLEKLKIELP